MTKTESTQPRFRPPAPRPPFTHLAEGSPADGPQHLEVVEGHLLGRRALLVIGGLGGNSIGFFGLLNHGLNHRLTHPQPEVTHL